MTTIVIVKAHCASTKEVQFVITDEESFSEKIILQDGEEVERVIYDNLVITVSEVEKQ